MARLVRSFVTLVMALTLVVSSLSVAAARGSAVQAGQMVICTGQGPMTVSVGADGTPVGPAHICPDCVISLIGALPDADFLPPERAWLSPSRPFVSVQGAPQVTRLPARARGPPSPI